MLNCVRSPVMVVVMSNYWKREIGSLRNGSGIYLFRQFAVRLI